MSGRQGDFFEVFIQVMFEMELFVPLNQIELDPDMLGLGLTVALQCNFSSDLEAVVVTTLEARTCVLNRTEITRRPHHESA